MGLLLVVELITCTIITCMPISSYMVVELITCTIITCMHIRTTPISCELVISCFV